MKNQLVIPFQIEDCNANSDYSELVIPHSLVLCAQELYIAFLLDLLSNVIVSDNQGSNILSLAADVTHIVSESCLADRLSVGSKPVVSTIADSVDQHGPTEPDFTARLLVLPIFIALGILPTNDAANVGEEIPPTSQITPPTDVSAQDPTTNEGLEARAIT